MLSNINYLYLKHIESNYYNFLWEIHFINKQRLILVLDSSLQFYFTIFPRVYLNLRIWKLWVYLKNLWSKFKLDSFNLRMISQLRSLTTKSLICLTDKFLISLTYNREVTNLILKWLKRIKSWYSLYINSFSNYHSNKENIMQLWKAINSIDLVSK